jgi:hypothetical protein
MVNRVTVSRNRKGKTMGTVSTAEAELRAERFEAARKESLAAWAEHEALEEPLRKAEAAYSDIRFKSQLAFDRAISLMAEMKELKPEIAAKMKAVWS